MVAASDVRHPGGVLGQHRVVAKPCRLIGQRASVGRLVGACAAHTATAIEVLYRQRMAGLAQLVEVARQGSVEFLQVGLVVFVEGVVVATPRGKGRAEGQHAIQRRCHVATGADHSLRRRGLERQGRAADLAAYRLQRQASDLAEVSRAIGGGDDDLIHLDGDAGVIALQGVAADKTPAAVLQRLDAVDAGLDEGHPWRAGELLAQLARPGPACQRIVKAAVGQREPGEAGGLVGVDATHHRVGKAVVIEKASLTTGLALVGTELQHATGRPQALLGVEPGEPALAVEQPAQIDPALVVGVGGELHV